MGAGDGIGGDEHLAHGGDEGDLAWLSPSDQAAMEGGEARAAAAGTGRGHGEHAADRAAPLGDRASARPAIRASNAAAPPRPGGSPQMA
jgi:hypothetical protein